MKSLQESASLFEVSMPEFKQLKTCRREIILLKSLWDMIVLVKGSFADWNTTLWSDINVEQMEMDCKKFVKEIRTLDKEMRAWDAFTGLYTTCMHCPRANTSLSYLHEGSACLHVYVHAHVVGTHQ